ncbi:MAG: serine/threonine protein kinase, partial [Alphaproteobacteria bacterium]|nr:serine/threonine protein kinase [Alphaproteobacteria bacterium]
MSFGRWSVIDQLGQGGMGVVWRAVDADGRQAAIKVARLRTAAREALRREVEALERLRHPGLVRFLEHGLSEDGALWVATELVEGQALRAHVTQTHPSTASSAPSTVVMEDGTWIGALREESEERPIWTREALLRELAVFRRLCDPLAWLHGEGHVHGDVKPENVLLRPDGSVVLVDLGLLRSFEGEGHETLHTSQRVVGTGAYLAPEQVQGRPPDGRSDLYAVGCMLYELLTGMPPFGHGWAAAQHHVRTPVPPLADRCDVPAQLEALVDALLRKDPRQRLGYATDLAEALEDFGVPATEGAPPVRRVLYRPRLVGRSEALDVIAGKGPVVLSGETGLGCTRLLSHLVERGEAVAASGRGGLVAGWLSSLASRARTEQLGSWFGHAAPVLGALQPTLGELLDVVPAAPTSRQEAVDAVLGALAAADWPTVGADEAELGDRLDQELLVELVRRAASVVVVSGDEALRGKLERLGARPLVLRPLTPEQVAELLEDALATDALPRELLDAVTSNAGGNPRFALQIAAQLVDEGALVRRRRRWGLVARDGLARFGLPEGLASVGERRLAAASSEARAAAERAAILGLSAIEAEERGLLEGARLLERREEGWAWAVPAFREVVARGLSPERRVALHEEALAALPDDAPHRVRAEHLLGAGREDDARRALAAARSEAVAR